MVASHQIKYRYQGKFDPLKLAGDNIDRLTMAMIPPKSKVLELGCATGFMGKYLVKNKRCRVIGVDINPHTKSDIAGDLDEPITWKKIKSHQPFDVVLASAVLEHLRFPQQTLKNIYQALKTKGFLVVSLPNIAHWRMRLHLLLGKFNYTEYGILDRTHLHFYTYFTAIDLIKAAGFDIIDIQIDPAGGMKFFNFIAKRWPNLYAHQIAIKAQKN